MEVAGGDVVDFTSECGGDAVYVTPERITRARKARPSCADRAQIKRRSSADQAQIEDDVVDFTSERITRATAGADQAQIKRTRKRVATGGHPNS